MGEIPWWQKGVIYQVYPRSFKDASGDGIGDLAGVTEKLGYLSNTLEVDAVWISPFYLSPMKDFGYDIADYTAVDSIFGTLNDSDELVEEAHRLDLKVILDYVPSHTSDEHPWFIESRSTRDNPKRDWYIWRDPKPDGSPPNNWLEETGGSVWELDAETGQFYLHSHYASQPDLNWRNPAVREAMFDVLRFWLGRGVDGFRVDVPHMLMKDPKLRDNPPNPDPKPNPYDRQHPNFHSQLHIHDRQHPDLHDVYRKMRRLLASYEKEGSQEKIMIGEIEVSPWDSWIIYYGENLDEFQMPFNFQLIETLWEAKAIRAFVDSFEATLPEGAWPNYVLGNHDRPRLASRYGNEQARVAAMLLLTLRGTPTLYQGDEIGMEDVEMRLERMQDPLGRDPTRTPMQWDASPNAGFCPLNVDPWLPVSPYHLEVNVASQLENRRSLLNLYRRLLSYRKTTPALYRGSYRAVDSDAENCYTYLREAEGKSILVALNFSAKEQRLHVPGLPPGETVLSTFLDRRETVDPAKLVLRENEGLVVEVASKGSL